MGKQYSKIGEGNYTLENRTRLGDLLWGIEFPATGDVLLLERVTFKVRPNCKMIIIDNRYEWQALIILSITLLLESEILNFTGIRVRG